MQKNELKQNVKSYAQKFEDGGLRLLKKSQKGVIHAIFSRFGLVLLLLLLQVGLLVSIFRWFGNLLPHYFGGSVVVTAAMVLYLLNSKMDNSAKITWMVVIALFPVVGVPLFFYVKSNFGHNILRKRLLELEDVLRTQLPQNQSVVQKLEASEPGAASLATYLYGRGGGFPVYENTAMTYFPSGEAKFEELLRQLETAEKYIDLLNRARRYIHIMTPYLILDGELETALKFAAERGVDVHLILPGIADKKFANSLAKTHYSSLLDSGVKISEWTPGFVHAKVFVVDDREAVVGTINLDYRSLYHHFEDAVWLTDAPCIRDIEADFQATLEQCRTVENDPRSIWQGRWLFRALGMLLKVLAPLL